MSDFADVDYFNNDALVTDPYPYFEYLRAHGPLHPESHHGVVMVTGYDEAWSIYNDVETFSSASSVTGPFPGFPVPLEGDDVSETIEQHRHELPMHDQLPCLDPPVHTDHRGLLMRLLTPKRLKENEDFMWRLADRQIDEFADRGSVEFISEYAGPFTLLVIADLLGVPEDEHAAYLEEMQGNKRHQAVMGNAEKPLQHNPLEFLYNRFTHYIEDRRREPRQDVLTSLATTTFADGSLPDVLDVARVAVNLFAAGQETTVRLLGSALQLIGERPALQAQLRNERERIPDFIEETLRFESPVKGHYRIARTSTNVGGVDVPAGTTVMLLNGAANRDPRRFDEPNEFKADRDNARQHLAFGRGIHSCPGGPLARAETRVSLERLLDRLSDIRISEEHHGPAGARRFEYVPTHMLRGLRRLHLEFTPVG
jgi:cytochrome P450